MPPEAQARTPEAAAAFVRYWFSLVNYGYLTGDVKDLASVSSADCETCQSTIDRITDQYQSGGSFTGGEISVELAVAGAADASGVHNISIRIDQLPLKRMLSDGSTGEVSDGESDLVLFARALPLSGSWTMEAIASGE
jgi:hypothetical protein